MSANAIDQRDWFLFHGAFTLVAAGCLAWLPFARGQILMGLVVAFNAGLPLFAVWRRCPHWIAIWLFVFPLSMFQILPDYFLAEVAGVIVFPDQGGPRVGPLSAYMGGLWAIPLFAIVYWSEQVSPRWRHAVAALLALLIFGVSEALSPTLGSWFARDVRMVGAVALYVLPAEALLGVAATVGYELSRDSTFRRLMAASAVMLFYAGSLAISLLFFEHICGPA